jgi:hypothetical protein
MKPGTQADLRRHLKAECGIDVTKNAISLLYLADDYRIHKTKQGKIKIEETAKSLVDSGFGERSAKLKARNGEKKPGKANDSKNSSSSEQPPEENIQDYIDGKKQVTLASPRSIITRYKEFQQAEKERINNEKAMKKLVDFDKTAELVFNFFRSLRDDLLEVDKRVGPISNMAATKNEAKKIISEEINRILTSKAGDEYRFDDALKKKIIQILKAQLR